MFTGPPPFLREHTANVFANIIWRLVWPCNWVLDRMMVEEPLWSPGWSMKLLLNPLHKLFSYFPPCQNQGIQRGTSGPLRMAEPEEAQTIDTPDLPWTIMWTKNKFQNQWDFLGLFFIAASLSWLILKSSECLICDS